MFICKMPKFSVSAIIAHLATISSPSSKRIWIFFSFEKSHLPNSRSQELTLIDALVQGHAYDLTWPIRFIMMVQGWIHGLTGSAKVNLGFLWGF